MPMMSPFLKAIPTGTPSVRHGRAGAGPCSCAKDKRNRFDASVRAEVFVGAGIWWFLTPSRSHPIVSHLAFLGSGDNDPGTCRANGSRGSARIISRVDAYSDL